MIVKSFCFSNHFKFSKYINSWISDMFSEGIMVVVNKDGSVQSELYSDASSLFFLDDKKSKNFDK